MAVSLSRRGHRSKSRLPEASSRDQASGSAVPPTWPSVCKCHAWPGWALPGACGPHWPPPSSQASRGCRAPGTCPGRHQPQTGTRRTAGGALTLEEHRPGWAHKPTHDSAEGPPDERDGSQGTPEARLATSTHMGTRELRLPHSRRWGYVWPGLRTREVHGLPSRSRPGR